jgi:uncharacterized damage-inducible protein DinB
MHPINKQLNTIRRDGSSTIGDKVGVARVFLDQASSFLQSDFQPKIERCLEQLSDEQIWWRPNPASNSVGNLVLHLCGNMRQWIIGGVGNRPVERDRDSEFNQREIIPRADLLDLLQTTMLAVVSVLNNFDEDALLDKREIQGFDVDVLQAVFHVTEHFSMHTGQILQLTKLMTQKDLGF